MPFISHGKHGTMYLKKNVFAFAKSLYICKQVACKVDVACLLVLLAFLCTLLLLYLSLFVDHVNKPLIFDFGACV